MGTRFQPARPERVRFGSLADISALIREGIKVHIRAFILSGPSGMLKPIMPKMDASGVAHLLNEFGRRVMLYGGNPYRAKAYLRAAERVALLTEPLGSLLAQNRLREIPGVGEAIAESITKLYATGSLPSLEKMRAEIPESVLEMLTVPGLRPEKVLKLYRELGIKNLEELEAACKEDRLKSVKGLGPALQRKIILGLQAKQPSQGRHIHRAAELMEGAKASLQRSNLGLQKIEIAGDLRRGNELITDLSLIAQKSGAKVSPLKFGELTVHVANPQRFGAALLFATGSEAHLRQLRRLAQKRGLSLEPNGLYRDGKLLAGRSEKDIYAALGLDFIEPELREGRNEIALARGHRFPPLVQLGDLRGILHAHTTASDGVNTLEQMASAVRKRGYSYFGVADHSRSAHYAGGLSLEQIDAQHGAIDELNLRYGESFYIFKGIESDILPDGSLDYPDPILSRFDFVVASVHGQFRKDRESQTERILRAVANPYTTILGHMTGRQLLRRPGYDIDVERILAACAERGVAVEINANPWRLDLDWRWHQKALELGCMFSINPDAHSTSEIDLIKWGVAMARKGGVPSERVLNALDLQSFRHYLEDRARIMSECSRTTPR
jgi:DNA polymerase (family X)